MLRILFTALMLGHVLEAEARRPPPPATLTAADPFALVVAACCLMAYFSVKLAFKISETKGYQATAVCVTVGAAAVAFPVMWSVCALAVPAVVIGYLVRNWRT